MVKIMKIKQIHCATKLYLLTTIDKAKTNSRVGEFS